MTPSQDEFQAFVTETAGDLEVPGVAVGIYIGGEEQAAFHGFTSIENPLPVNGDTLFQFGSTGKTYTATAIMRLVDQGVVDLEAPVRTYVPEFRLKDEDAARTVKILNLLNHTAGWQGDMHENTGDGDDAIAKYVEKMADLEQITPVGKTVSYNNASLSLAGRVIEKVTGKTFEQALKELLFIPLGLDRTFFFMNDIMTRRFATGHNQKPDGTIHVARPWALARGGGPAGGISSNAGDQLVWARFHLGDGTAKDGTRILPASLLKRMQEPTVDMPGSALGDYVGISWMLHDVEGVRLVGHGGDVIGQHSAFQMVPEKDFAIASLTNCGPNGNQFNDQVVKWALESYCGVIEKDPDAIDASEAQLAPYAGTFETIAAWVDITVEAPRLVINVRIKPETLAQLVADGEDPPEPQPIPLGLVAGTGDRYIVTDGPAKGMKGYFARGDSGEIDAVHVGGRLATRTSKVPVTAS